MPRKNKKSRHNDKSNAKVIDFRLWQRKKLKKLISQHQLTDSLAVAEKLGFKGEWGIELIRHLQSGEVAR